MAAHNPVRVAIVGVGTFALMFLAQARRTPGIHVVAAVDLDVSRARAGLASVGWTGDTQVSDRLNPVLESGSIEVLVEATGDPLAGVAHALAGIEAGSHVVMVNVEADALAGPLLARRAADRGVIYSLAYGDQPALICELVDWARTCGMEVVAAGKGTRYLPSYRTSTPDTVWDLYGISAGRARTPDTTRRCTTRFSTGPNRRSRW